MPIIQRKRTKATWTRFSPEILAIRRNVQKALLAKGELPSLTHANHVPTLFRRLEHQRVILRELMHDVAWGNEDPDGLAREIAGCIFIIKHTRLRLKEISHAIPAAVRFPKRVHVAGEWTKQR